MTNFMELFNTNTFTDSEEGFPELVHIKSFFLHFPNSLRLLNSDEDNVYLNINHPPSSHLL